MGLSYIIASKKYTEEELEYIKNNWGIIPVTDMARYLKVSRKMIQTQADKMNLPKLGTSTCLKWTEEELNKLKKIAKTKTSIQLANYFKTTTSAIYTVASRNNITLIDRRIHFELF